MSSMIRLLIQRQMKNVPLFSRGESASATLNLTGLESDEEVIGCYQNPLPTMTKIVFTDKAIYVFGHKVLRLAWNNILDFEMPQSKGNATGVNVTTADGAMFVPISGAHGPDGKYKDVFCLTMILNMLLRKPARLSDG